MSNDASNSNVSAMEIHNTRFIDDRFWEALLETMIMIDRPDRMPNQGVIESENDFFFAAIETEEQTVFCCFKTKGDSGVNDGLDDRSVNGKPETEHDYDFRLERTEFRLPIRADLTAGGVLFLGVLEQLAQIRQHVFKNREENIADIKHSICISGIDFGKYGRFANSRKGR